MKKIIELYQEYFDAQEELYKIQQDRNNWPEGWDYSDMVKRVNELNPLTRLLSRQIRRVEKQ